MRFPTLQLSVSVSIVTLSGSFGAGKFHENVQSFTSEVKLTLTVKNLQQRVP